MAYIGLSIEYPLTEKPPWAKVRTYDGNGLTTNMLIQRRHFQLVIDELTRLVDDE